jgi:hypothetical protein
LQLVNFEPANLSAVRKKLMSEASKSHPKDALDGHSKASQRPVPANQQPGTTSKTDETLSQDAKTKPQPGHVGPRGASKPDETLGKSPANRKHPGDAAVKGGVVQRALKSGPHSAQSNADGTLHSTPTKHGKTSGTASLP